MTERRSKVLVAKPGLDGHDRGARMVVRALEDAGLEVYYTGIRQTPEQIADAAAEHEVDVVGLSILSGAHMELVPRVMDALEKRGLESAIVFVGGIIPEVDRIALREMGVMAVFGPGSRTGDIDVAIRQAVEERRQLA
ncbi:MAG: cobalamin B12-binding domain-containing protein [Chloroflexi bacterium]|nr:cobalamin B12-binding domain-containing protein [Chloroflexota bacterium]